MAEEDLTGKMEVTVVALVAVRALIVVALVALRIQVPISDKDKMVVVKEIVMVLPAVAAAGMEVKPIRIPLMTEILAVVAQAILLKIGLKVIHNQEVMHSSRRADRTKLVMPAMGMQG